MMSQKSYYNHDNSSPPIPADFQETQTEMQTPALTTGLPSFPSSPSSPTNITTSHRPSHTLLPRLLIPSDTRKLTSNSHGTKRKLEFLPEAQPYPRSRSFLRHPHTVVDMWGCAVVDYPAEPVVEDRITAFSQELSISAEALKEAHAQQMEVSQILAKQEKTIIAQCERINKFENLLRELNIPEESWP